MKSIERVWPTYSLIKEGLYYHEIKKTSCNVTLNISPKRIIIYKAFLHEAKFIYLVAIVQGIQNFNQSQ